MADYDWFDPAYYPPEPPDPYKEEAKKYRPLGLEAVFEKSDFIGPQVLPIKYYKCRRGCGTLVWDPEEHIKNVCTEFNPVVGKD